MNIESKCLYSGYSPKNGEPQALPIYQSTTFKYASTAQVAKLFDLEEDGFFYSRLGNPTVNAVENKIADLEGGVGALMTSSGQSASFMSLLNILGAGDHFISSGSIYGGTVNLFNVTMRKMGIDVTFLDNDASEDEIRAAFKPNTKAVFGETISNPTIHIFDIEKWAKIAHENKVPIIVDNTFATPILCRPFEFGADIVIHSTTKYMDGHALTIGGVIVDSGNFDWTGSGKFPEYTTPDESYHGVVYTERFGKSAYIVKARVQLLRDLGCVQSAECAFHVNQGLETLPLRIIKHSENADIIAHELEKHPKIESVWYPTLSSYPYQDRREKYLPKGCSGVIAVKIKGGREDAAKFIDSLKMISLLVHVADIRTCVLHPASSTHRQLTNEQLAAAGIEPNLIRLSVGLENTDDIMADITQALDKI